MQTKILRTFVQLAETLHFARSAAQLGIAQATLSQQISALESELGVQLLHRDNRNVRLTAAGALFVDEARRLLEQADAAVERTRRVARGELGQLRVAAASAAWPELLPLALERLAERCPELKVSVAEHCSSVQETMLLSGEIDVGLLHPPLVAAGLGCEPLLAEPMVLALREGHPLAGSAQVPLAALDDQVLLVHRREAGPHLYARIEQALADAGVAPRLEPGPCELPVVLGLVRARRGLAIVPGSARLMPWPGVVLRPLAGQPLQLELALAWRRGEPLAAAQHLRRALQAVCDSRRALASVQQL